MAAPTTISEAITQNALGPAHASEAGRALTTKTSDDLIRADQYQKGEQAGALTGDYGFGLRYAQLQPPAAG